MKVNIGLIDYGMGNLHSVEQSFKRLNQAISIVREPKNLNNCQALILPGVGAFDPAMENLQKTNLIPELKQWALDKRPLLGICLGLQLMFESSDEGKKEGLGIIKGKIKHLPIKKEEHIPNIGWALLRRKTKCPLFNETTNPQWMYFVHSYSAVPADERNIAATIDFGGKDVTAIVWKERLAACQFHPEKSGKSGERLLFNWLSWLKKEMKSLG